MEDFGVTWQGELRGGRTSEPGRKTGRVEPRNFLLHKVRVKEGREGRGEVERELKGLELRREYRRPEGFRSSLEVSYRHPGIERTRDTGHGGRRSLEGGCPQRNIYLYGVGVGSGGMGHCRRSRWTSDVVADGARGDVGPVEGVKSCRVGVEGRRDGGSVTL